jgi:uncharacterized membrane protein YqiK
MQLTPSGRRFIAICVIVVVIINALVTLWLVKTVLHQSGEIRTLQRNDKVTQAVEDVNSRVDTLKSKVEGLFR